MYLVLVVLQVKVQVTPTVVVVVVVVVVGSGGQFAIMLVSLYQVMVGGYCGNICCEDGPLHN